MNFGKTFFLCCLLLNGISAHGTAKASRVLMVINEGYRPEEYFIPRKIFQDSGFLIKVSARNKGKIFPSKKHISEVSAIEAELSFEEVVVKDFDALVFVGGNGAWNEFLPNPQAGKLLLESVKLNKVTALICAATGLLATADNLDGLTPHFKGKHVTGFKEVVGLLEKLGQVQYDPGVNGQPFVVTDGNLVTARDPQSAKLFGEKIKNILKKGE